MPGRLNRCLQCMHELEPGNAVCPKCGFNNSEYTLEAKYLQPESILHNRYITGKLIGEGQYGLTYIGWDNFENRAVAIKEYFPIQLVTRNTFASSGKSVLILDEMSEKAYREGLNGYEHEIRKLSMFNDFPGIVQVLDSFKENGTAYIIMEFVTGVTLRAYIRNKRRLEPEYTFEMMKPLINSLSKIHKVGMYHLNINPDDIMVSSLGKATLINFDTARGSSDGSTSLLLKNGFAPVEQYLENGEQGPWTDIYSMCAVLYFMLTGKVPQDAVSRAQKDDLKSISELGVKIPESQEKAIMKGLALYSEDRFQNMSALYKGLFENVTPEAGNVQAQGNGSAAAASGTAAGYGVPGNGTVGTAGTFSTAGTMTAGAAGTSAAGSTGASGKSAGGAYGSAGSAAVSGTPAQQAHGNQGTYGGAGAGSQGNASSGAFGSTAGGGKASSQKKPLPKSDKDDLIDSFISARDSAESSRNEKRGILSGRSSRKSSASVKSSSERDPLAELLKEKEDNKKQKASSAAAGRAAGGYGAAGPASHTGSGAAGGYSAAGSGIQTGAGFGAHTAAASGSSGQAFGSTGTSGSAGHASGAAEAKKPLPKSSKDDILDSFIQARDATPADSRKKKNSGRTRAAASPAGGKSSGGNKKLFIIIGAVVVILIIVIIAARGCSNSNSDANDENTRIMTGASSDTGSSESTLSSDASSSSGEDSQESDASSSENTDGKSGDTKEAGGMKVSFPDLKGMSEDEVKQAVGTVDKGIKITFKEDYSDAGTKDKAYDQSIKAGSSYKAGDSKSLTVKICKGPASVSVPDVKGKSRGKAEDAVKDAGLKASFSEDYSSDTAKGNVISQDPKSGSKLKRGGTVKIKVSKGKKPEPKKAAPSKSAGSSSGSSGSSKSSGSSSSSSKSAPSSSKSSSSKSGSSKSGSSKKSSGGIPLG